MNTALTTQEHRAFLSQEKVQLVKRMYCAKASDVEFQHFIEVCQSRQLDPVLKQIYAVFRWSTKENRNLMSIQIGIDGFRALAARTGEYAGSDAAQFEWKDDCDLPLEARVTVYRLVHGQRCAFTGVAYWDEYFPQEANAQFMWKKMPKSQLAKCAEAIALRKAFPSDLSGLYEPAEMNQAGFEFREQEDNNPMKKEIAAPVVTAGFEFKQPPQPEVLLHPSRSQMLEESVVPFGAHKGKKLRDMPKAQWQEYEAQVRKNLLSPDFPVGMKKEAEAIVNLISGYLGDVP